MNWTHEPMHLVSQPMNGMSQPMSAVNAAEI